MTIGLSSRRAHLIVATIAVVLLSAVNNGPMFWNHEAPGDFVDGRFNMFVLEHAYQWLIGHDASLVSPAIFYPFPDVLFFSDTHAGSALVFAVFRALGLSEPEAFDGWFLVGYVATYAAAHYALARFGADALTAALGAAIFAFGLPSVAQFGHAQLVYRCGVPLALLSLWQGIRDGSARSLLWAFFWLCLQILISVYLGMFLLVVMVVFALAAPLTEPTSRGPRAWLRAVFAEPIAALRSRPLLANGFTIALLVSIAAAAATLAMLAGYAHASHEYHFKRQWNEVSTMVPRPVSYLLMAPLPYWSSISSALSAKVPMAHEHNLFLGFGAMAFFAVGLLAILRNAKAALGATPARAMLATLFAVVILSLAIGDDFTLYRSISTLPGLNAIRAVSRIGLVLAFPAALVAAIGLRSLLAESQPRLLGALAALLFVGLAGYEFATIERQTSSIAESERRIDAVVVAAREQARGVASPVLLLVDPANEDFQIQLDAMLAAERLGWPTVNGYSGNIPPGAAPTPSCSVASRQFQGYAAWRARRNRTDGPDDAEAALKRVVFVGADCDSDPLNRILVPAPTHTEPTSEDLPSEVAILPGAIHRAGSTLLFDVKIKNNSADKWLPGRSSDPVSLSWRFAPAEGEADDDNEGWTPREPLPTDVAPGASIFMSATGAVPDKPGKYRLEVSLVADGLFWFHDKGMQPLRFDEIVTVP